MKLDMQNNTLDLALLTLMNHGKHIEQVHNDMTRDGIPVRSQGDMILEVLDIIKKTGSIPYPMMRLSSIKKRMKK